MIVEVWTPVTQFDSVVRLPEEQAVLCPNHPLAGGPVYHLEDREVTLCAELQAVEALEDGDEVADFGFQVQPRRAPHAWVLPVHEAMELGALAPLATNEQARDNLLWAVRSTASKA